MRYRIRKHDWSLALGATLGLLMAAGSASAQVMESAAERILERSSGPDTYYFFEDEEKTVVDYNSERYIRVCTGDSKHLVPLKIIYDEKQTTIGSNDCIRIEAATVTLSPNETLDNNAVIVAEVQTVS